MSSPRDRIEARLGLGGPPLQRLRSGPPAIPDHDLIRRIGQGAYGEVWLARNALGSLRAVKVVYRDNFKDDRPYEREFAGIRRFEPLSRHNEGFVDVLQVGRNDTEGWFYYVMELADDAGAAESGGVGESAGAGRGPAEPPVTPEARPLSPHYVPRTLSSDLRQRGRLPLEECLELGLTLTLALGYLHRHGLIHRDVKPSNIIYVGGVPKLADIGLVTEAGEANTFVGTEGFVPPEGPGTPSADLYALGKVLYEAAMGKDRQEFPEPPSRLGVDRESLALMEFNAVLLRACASEAKARYGSAEEMHADLALLQSGRSVTRARRLERRLKLVTRSVAGLAALAVVVAFGWWWQAVQTREVRELVEQKAGLLEDKRRLTQTQEGQIIRAFSAAAMQRIVADDASGALPWLVEALRRVEVHAPNEVAAHRLRLGNLLRYQPQILSVTPHTGAVHALAFSPDGRWLAAGGEAGVASLVEVATGRTVRSLAHSNAVTSVEFSPDSRRLLTASRDFHARLWPLDATGEPLMLSHNGPVRSAAFSPDGGRVVTASLDRTARIWSSADGQPIGSALRHTQPVYHACFSPDGERIAVGTGEEQKFGELHLWDARAGRELAPMVYLKDLATWTAFSPDGLRVASACGEASFDFQLSRPGVLADGGTGALIRELDHVDRITHVSFSPDGARLAAATVAYEVLILDARTGRRLLPPLKHARWVHWAVFSPDGRWLASASSDGTARVWDAATGTPLTPPLKHPGEVYRAVFDPAGRRLATAGDGGLIYLWDVGHGAPDLPSFWYSPGETGVLLSPDDRLAVTYAPRRENARMSSRYPGRGEEPVRVHELATGRLLWTLTVPGGYPFRPAQFGPAGVVLGVGSYNGQIRLWDLRTGALRWESAPFRETREVGAFSRDGRHLAVVASGQRAGPSEVHLLNVRDGQPTIPALPHPRPVGGVVFRPDDQVLATAGHDGRIRLWETATGRLLRTMVGSDGELDAVRFSGDGRRLLVAGKFDKTARVLDAESGAPAFAPMRHSGIVWDAVFDRDERRILTISQDGTAAQWDARTGERIEPSLPHPQELIAGGYDGSGRLIATSCADQSVRVWSADSGELLASPFRHGIVAQAARLTRDGRKLVASFADGSVRAWDLVSTDWPLDSLRLYAEALAVQAVGADGRSRGLSGLEIAARLETLRMVRAGDFAITEEQMRQWHHREALEAAGAGNEFAARFHAARSVRRNSPDESGSTTTLTSGSSARIPAEVAPGEFRARHAASLTNSGQISIHFGRELPAVSAATAATNYDVPGATVTGVQLSPDRQGVLLDVSGLSGSRFTVRVGRVTDVEGKATSEPAVLHGTVLPLESRNVGRPDDPLFPGVVFSRGPGDFDVVAGGSDIWDSTDQFHYLHELRTGDFDVKVRVASLDAINRWTKAALMVRETLAANSRQILAGVTPVGSTVDGLGGGQGNNEYQTEYRPGTGRKTESWGTHPMVGHVPFPNAWVRLRRQGNTFSAYRSSDARTWIQLGSVEQDYPATVHLGLATTAHNNEPELTALARYREYGPTGNASGK